MSATTLVTAADLLALPTGMGKRYELVAGELRVMSPSGWRHGIVVNNLEFLLTAYIRQKDLGRGFGAETGFLLKRDPDTVRAPDYAFITKQHLPGQEPAEAFWPGAPDLAVEVLSQGDTTGEVDEKIQEWLSGGCGMVWVVDPKLRTVTIFRSPTDVEVKTAADTLVGDPVVPGFSCPVDELFS